MKNSGKPAITTITGNITNLTGTLRKHEVWLVDSALTTDVDLQPACVAAGATTDLSGNYQITCSLSSNGNFKLLVDRIWLSNAYFLVLFGQNNPGKNVTLVASPGLPPVTADGETIVAGWIGGLTPVQHPVTIHEAGQSAVLKSGKTSKEGYYRLASVPYNANYDIRVNTVLKGTIGVGAVYDSALYDVERHDL